MLQFLIVIIYITFISLGLPDSILGSAWPSMYPGLEVPISYAGILSMLIAGCTILSSLMCDRIVRRIGTGKIIVVSVAMTATALFGFSVSSSFLWLCLWTIPYGLGAGAVDAVLNNFVALHYKAQHMNWLHCFWGVGATLGPYIMGACLTGNLGWHIGYRSISLIQIVLTALLIFSLPLWKKKLNQTQQKEASASPLNFRQLIALPSAKQTLFAFFCYISLEQMTGLWGSSYMVLQKGIAPEAAASYISFFYLGITGGRFLSGLVSIKLNAKAMIRLGEGLILIGITLLFVSNKQSMLLIGLVLIGLGCAPIFPSLLHQTPERFGHQASQSMMGLQMACAYIGSTITPALIGLLTERIDAIIFPIFELLFTVIMVCMIEYCNRRAQIERRTVDEPIA